MDILGDTVMGLLRRRVFRPHPVAAQRPARAAVLGEPDAPSRNGDPYLLRIAWVDTDRMKARQIGSAACPLLALGMILKGPHHLPALSIVV
jgi:hypothetical protein